MSSPYLKEDFRVQLVHAQKERKIGVGSYGDVYRCVTESGEDVAVKVFECNEACGRKRHKKLATVKEPPPCIKETTNSDHSCGLCKNSRDCEYRFQQTCHEAYIMMLLRNSPNVVQCYGLSHPSHTNMFQPHLVMELCDANLEARIWRMKNGIIHGNMFEWDTVKHVIRGIVSGLNSVHENGLIHRDVKPANVLITDLAEIKLCDFSLTRRGSLGNFTLHGLSEDAITWYYRPPELLIAAMKHCMSIRTDVWAVACILIEMLNLRKLFEVKEGPNMYAEVFMRIVGVLGPPTRETWPRLWVELAHKPGLDELVAAATKAARAPGSEHYYPNGIIDACPRLAEDPDALDFVSRILLYDPSRRMTPSEALGHKFIFLSR